jgi:hypothetical protein
VPTCHSCSLLRHWRALPATRCYTTCCHTPLLPAVGLPHNLPMCASRQRLPHATTALLRPAAALLAATPAVVSARAKACGHASAQGRMLMPGHSLSHSPTRHLCFVRFTPRTQQSVHDRYCHQASLTGDSLLCRTIVPTNE